MSIKILNNSVRFKSSFAENYTLITKTKIKAAYFDLQTTTKIRWALRVISVDENGNTEIELFTLEHLTVETNNENLNDIFSLNQVFSRMYSEIRVVINLSGKVIRILNLQQIKDKWQDTKKQLLKIQLQEPALHSLITINDEIFLNDYKIKLAIENNEFFYHYFSKIYGKTIPIANQIIKQKNILQTADTDWVFKFDYSPQFDLININDIAIKFNALADTHQESWKKQAYGHLPDIETKNVKPNLTQDGIYRYNFKTGKLYFSKTTITEIAMPNFIEGSMEFILESDTYKENSKTIIDNSRSSTFNVLD
jgi:hypothetical protein